MDLEGIEPSTSGFCILKILEPEILPLNYRSMISEILLNSDSSIIYTIFFPIKKVSLLDTLIAISE